MITKTNLSNAKEINSNSTFESEYPEIDQYQQALEGSQEKSRLLDELTAQHLGLVKKLANKYSNNEIEFDDLLQSGYYGLQYSFDKFESGRGLRFSTYAVPNIFGQIQKELRNARLIYMPCNAQGLAKQQIQPLVEQGRSLEDIAEDLGESLEYVADCYQGFQKTSALPQGENGEELVFSPLPEADYELVTRLVGQLDSDAQTAVWFRANGWTFKAIAEYLKKTSKQVKDWYYQGLDWLKEQIIQQEEFDLIERAGQGCSRALRALVREHKGLIHKAADRFDYRVEKDVLVAAGEWAIHVAARGFNPLKGVKFPSYLARVLISELRDCYCRETNQTRYAYDQARKVSRANSDIYRKTGKEATLKEISGVSGLSEAQIKNALKQRMFTQSYSLNYSDGEGGAELLDFCEDTSANPWGLLENEEFVTDCNNLVLCGHMAIRDKDVLLAKSEGSTTADLSAMFGVGAERIRQLVKRGKKIFADFKAGLLDMTLPAIEFFVAPEVPEQLALDLETPASSDGEPLAVAEKIKKKFGQLFSSVQEILSRSKSTKKISKKVFGFSQKQPKFPVTEHKEKNVIKRMLALGALAFAPVIPAIANPASVPLSTAFGQTQRLDVAKGIDHYLDFSGTRYRITKVYPSNPNEFRGLLMSQGSNQQLVLKWLPNSTAKQTSLLIEVVGPEGTKNLTLLVNRVKKAPTNIRTMFAAPPEAVAQVPIEAKRFERLPPKTEKFPRLDAYNPSPASIPAPSPVRPLPRIRVTPKPVRRRARVAANGRMLLDRSQLDNKALANYLLRGLHRARGRKQINRSHDNYWYAQSMARLLKRGTSVSRSLQLSKLPAKTFDDLLGHGGVGR